MKTKARGKIVRRLGINFFGNMKYNRLLEKKPNGPGKSRSARPAKLTEYGRQLLEKQKIRYYYGLSEKQFRNTFFKAKAKTGETGECFIQMLESRLDNIVYRLGWCFSRPQSRQMVSHGHIKVNGRSVDIPSMILKPGDVISVIDKEKIKSLVTQRFDTPHIAPAAPWFKVDNEKLTAEYSYRPSMEEASPVASVQSVIEYYSK